MNTPSIHPAFQSENGVFVIAEIGGNHEGDFSYAKVLTQLAAEAGADAIKFQIYTGDSLVNRSIDPDRAAHFDRFSLKKEEYIELAELCQQLGKIFMASIWDIEAFEIFDPYLSIYKIGSGDLTAFNFLHRTAAIGKPIILSTGLATLAEIKEAMEFIIKIDPSYRTENKLALLQCTSMYPIPNFDTNLNVMKTLREHTRLPVGYSDHTIGGDAIEIAVAMGAQIIEVHFTDDRKDKSFRDHQVSLTRDEIRRFISKIKTIREIQGLDKKSPTRSEIDSGHVQTFRRGLYARRDLQRGSVVTEDDIVALRPLNGLSARHFYEVVGKKLDRDVNTLQPFLWEYFDIKESEKTP